MIGDGIVTDLAAANAVGARTILMLTGVTTGAALEALPPRIAAVQGRGRRGGARSGARGARRRLSLGAASVALVAAHRPPPARRRAVVARRRRRTRPTRRIGRGARCIGVALSRSNVSRAPRRASRRPRDRRPERRPPTSARSATSHAQPEVVEARRGRPEAGHGRLPVALAAPRCRRGSPSMSASIARPREPSAARRSRIDLRELRRRPPRTAAWPAFGRAYGAFRSLLSACVDPPGAAAREVAGEQAHGRRGCRSRRVDDVEVVELRRGRARTSSSSGPRRPRPGRSRNTVSADLEEQVVDVRSSSRIARSSSPTIQSQSPVRRMSSAMLPSVTVSLSRRRAGGSTRRSPLHRQRSPAGRRARGCWRGRR